MGKQLTFDDFMNRMDKADKKLLKNLRKRLMVIALKSEREAKINATDFPQVRTGRLRSSITAIVDAEGGRMRALLRAGGNSGGDPVNYARYVEFGTRKMSPRLFMGRAVDTVSKNIPKDLREVLSMSLEVS